MSDEERKAIVKEAQNAVFRKLNYVLYGSVMLAVILFYLTKWTIGF